MIVIGYFSAALIGISLGLIGGGGSILTVPVLVYLFHVDPEMATAYSLFIVGFSSLVGVFPKYKQGLVDFKTAFIFGAPSILAVFLTRKFLVPAIPESLFSIGFYEVTKPILLMMLFAILMVAASFSMIVDKKAQKEEVTEKRVFNLPLILLEGAVVGVLTGLVGAGGGFLIIPALVMLSKLPMKMAIGTSLIIIAAKSLIGFVGDALVKGNQMDFQLLIIVTLIASVGIFIGNYLSLFVDGKKLKKGFGWFVLVLGCYIIVNQLFLHGASH